MHEDYSSVCVARVLTLVTLPSCLFRLVEPGTQLRRRLPSGRRHRNHHSEATKAVHFAGRNLAKRVRLIDLVRPEPFFLHFPHTSAPPGRTGGAPSEQAAMARAELELASDPLCCSAVWPPCGQICLDHLIFSLFLNSFISQRFIQT